MQAFIRGLHPLLEKRLKGGQETKAAPLHGAGLWECEAVLLRERLRFIPRLFALSHWGKAVNSVALGHR